MLLKGASVMTWIWRKPMTVWGKDSESDTNLYDNVQIEIGCDATDIWLSFNKSVAAVQMTHAEYRELLKQMEEALNGICVRSEESEPM
jgi:hypothetical protein